MFSLIEVPSVEVQQVLSPDVNFGSKKENFRKLSDEGGAPPTRYVMYGEPRGKKTELRLTSRPAV